MALSIGWLEIRIIPSKGKSISRIRKMAPATESVDAIKATVAVGFSAASRLKLRKMGMSQQITRRASAAKWRPPIGQSASSGAAQIP